MEVNKNIMEIIERQIFEQDDPTASRDHAKSLLTNSPNRNTIKNAIKSLLPSGSIEEKIKNGSLDNAVDNVIYLMKTKYSIVIRGGKKSRKSRKHRKSKKYRKSRKYSKKR